jgi:hypothetical protein
MGWEIHITRAEFWAENDEHPITAEEWLDLVQEDPELTIDARDNGPYFALWNVHSIGNDHPWFDLFEGSINTKYPDRKTLGKAIQIARRLGARVQGDDGEEYKRPEDMPE